MPRGTHFITCSVFLSLLVARADAWFQRKPSYSITSTLFESKKVFSFEVNDDGKVSAVEIEEDESILAAMERSGAIPDIPSDCRRGNCLTCAGRHASGSQQNALLRGPDGLSPQMSRELEERGHILLCSSYVTDDGLRLDLGANHRAWDEMYHQRLEDDSIRLVALQAVAKAMRLRSEANVEKWTEETEVLLEKSGE